MLKATNLTKSYGKRKVLIHVDCQVSAGEMLGILGPNGSGKSTLIRLLSGLEPPDKGKIWLNETPLVQFSVKERARQLAVVPQEGAEALPISVEEYLFMGREPYQHWWPWYRADDEKIVNDWIQQLDLQSFKAHPLYGLSGGERQRVEIAKVMVQAAKYILLDEPTNHLDLKYQLAVLSMLKQLKEEQQIAIVIVMHDINLAAQFCDSLLFLKDGRRIDYGQPAQIITQDLMQTVYGVDALVISHPKTSIPQVLYH